MLRALIVGSFFFTVTPLLVLVQWLLEKLKAPGAAWFGVKYYRLLCRMLRINVRIVGEPVRELDVLRRAPARPPAGADTPAASTVPAMRNAQASRMFIVQSPIPSSLDKHAEIVKFLFFCFALAVLNIARRAALQEHYFRELHENGRLPW